MKNDDTRGIGALFIVIAILGGIASFIQYKMVQKSKLAGAVVGAETAIDIAKSF